MGTVNLSPLGSGLAKEPPSEGYVQLPTWPRHCRLHGHSWTWPPEDRGQGGGQGPGSSAVSAKGDRLTPPCFSGFGSPGKWGAGMVFEVSALCVAAAPEDSDLLPGCISRCRESWTPPPHLPHGQGELARLLVAVSQEVAAITPVGQEQGLRSMPREVTMVPPGRGQHFHWGFEVPRVPLQSTSQGSRSSPGGSQSRRVVTSFSLPRGKVSITLLPVRGPKQCDSPKQLAQKVRPDPLEAASWVWGVPGQSSPHSGRKATL